MSGSMTGLFPRSCKPCLPTRRFGHSRDYVAGAPVEGGEEIS